MNRILPVAAHIRPISLAGESDFELGGIRVCPSRREIRAGEKKDTVEPRVMQVLVVLARAEGGIVSRDTLIEQCWGGRIVGEAAINTCVTKVRALANLSGEPAFEIETVPKVGYRLVRLAKESGATPAAGFREAAGKAVTTPFPKYRVLVAWAGGAGASLGLLAAALWFLSILQHAPPPSPEASVAVLPFVNMSGDPGKDYFSDGFTEELINDLSNDPHLRVIARTSAFAFKGKNLDIENIARALHVQNVVEGSVRENGSRVRITAQLINAANGYHLWSKAYDRNISDILGVQNEVARTVAAALTDKIVAPASVHPKIDPAVYRLYLQAGRERSRVTLEGYRKAVALYREVIARQPDFIKAYAGLAWSANSLAEFDPAHANNDIAIAADAGQSALSLDPNNLDAKLVRAILDVENWNWSAASSDLRAFRRAPPNNATALHALRVYYNSMAFPDLAIALVKRAMILNPLSDNLRAQLSFDLLHQRELKPVAELDRSWLAHSPDNPRPLSDLCSSYALMGLVNDARQIQEQLHRLKSDDPSCDFEIDVASGNLTRARRIIDNWIKEFPDDSPYAQDIATAYMELNDFDRAGDWLERAYERRELDFFRVAFGPQAAKYRATSPRWKPLTQQPAFREWQAEHDRIAAELSRSGQAAE